DGKLFACTTANCAVVVLDWKQRQPRHAFPGHSGVVAAMAYAPDGKVLATGGWDHTVRLWDAADGKPLRTLHGPDAPVRVLAYAPDGQSLAAGGWAPVVIWDPHTGKKKQELGGPWAHSFSFSSDARDFAAGVFAAEPHLWQLQKDLWVPLNK